MRVSVLHLVTGEDVIGEVTNRGNGLGYSVKNPITLIPQPNKQMAMAPWPVMFVEHEKGETVVIDEKHVIGHPFKADEKIATSYQQLFTGLVIPPGVATGPKVLITE